MTQHRRAAFVLLVAALTLASSDLSAAPALACDAQQAGNDSAVRVLQDQHIDVGARLDAAESASRKVLSKDQKDFRANQTLALIHLYRAGTNHKQYLAAVSELIQTADLLGGIAPDCAKAKDYYRIYNTIGAEYYNDSDYDQALQYYSIAYSNLDKLSDQSKGWLHANLALLALHRRDYACAYKGYQLAAQLGDKTYDVVQNFQKMQQIFWSAQVAPKCRQKII